MESDCTSNPRIGIIRSLHECGGGDGVCFLGPPHSTDTTTMIV